MDHAIEMIGVSKTFGAVRALRSLDLEVGRGTVLGLLGPNGAGKSTAVKILSTLLSPDSGRAAVAGHDVAADPAGVRRSIGMSGQFSSVDGKLTGRQNLELIALLHHLPKAEAKRRTESLLEEFDLLDAAKRPAGTYSGGMRRRLDLAAALVSRPAVLILDEPTTGLDPVSRRTLWSKVAELAKDGTTVLLATQYMDEAEALADSIALIDRGELVRTGTVDELVREVGGDRVDLTVAEPLSLPLAAAALAPFAKGAVTVDEERLCLSLEPGPGRRLADLVRAGDDAGAAIADIRVRRATLDEAFIQLTATGRAPAVAGGSRA